MSVGGASSTRRISDALTVLARLGAPECEDQLADPDPDPDDYCGEAYPRLVEARPQTDEHPSHSEAGLYAALVLARGRASTTCVPSAYDCQALAALRSMIWPIPSRMRDRHAERETAGSLTDLFPLGDPLRGWAVRFPASVIWEAGTIV